MPIHFGEERFRAVIEHSLDAIALVETDGTVAYVSPGVTRVLGYTPEEFVALGPFDPVHPDDRDAARRRFADIARQPGGTQTVLNRVRHKDGSWRWVETVATNQLDNPSVRAVVANFRDITDRRRLEEALREREEHFRLIVESATDYAIFSLGTDGRIMSWNSGAERILGYTEEEVLGRHVSLIFTPEDNAAGRAEYEMHGAYAAGHETDDRWHMRKGGGRFWANGMMMPLKDDAGAIKGYLKILRDRTRQKRDRDALKSSEERLRLAVDAARLGLWHAGLPLDRLVWNDRCKKHFGLAPEAEVTVETFYERVHPDDRATVREAVDGALAGEGGGYRVEFRTVAPDGRVRWIESLGRVLRDDDGRPSRFDGVTINVTDRKLAEAALRESETRFRNLADSAPVMVWMAGPDKLCTYFNRPWLEFTGRTPGEELGNGWAEGIHVEDYERCLGTYSRAFDAREPFEMEYRLRRRDGLFRWVLDKAIPLFGAGGEFTGYIGSCIDITERRQTEEVLKDADRRKDEFLAMLAHELRNPLAAIRSALGVSRRPGMEEHLEWARDVMERQTTHLIHLIDDLLDVSRISRGKVQLRPEYLDASTPISRAVEASRPLIEEKQHELTVGFAPGPMRLHADATRLEQIIVNLLSNAAKYTEPGGRIELRAAKEGDEVIIEVRDTGIGIPPEKLGSIFDLFTQIDPTIDRSQGGLGIGLSLVRTLAELHGGSVVAASEGPGRGSVFTVRLPAAQGETPEEPTPASPASAGGGPGGRVLIVDDNRDTAHGMARLLKAAGFEAETAHDGPAALGAARRTRPDVILMDIGLPGMDGYEVVRRLREDDCCRAALVVAISGYGQPQDRERSREAGFDHHLVKPVDYPQLMSLLAGHSGRGLGERSRRPLARE